MGSAQVPTRPLPRRVAGFGSAASVGLEGLDFWVLGVFSRAAVIISYIMSVAGPTNACNMHECSVFQVARFEGIPPTPIS